MAATGATVAAYIGDAIFYAAVDIGLSEGAALVVADVATWAAGAAGTYAISSGVSALLSGGGPNQPASPKSEGGAFSSQASSRTHLLRSTVANRQIIYGQAMVSGPMIFAASNDNYGTLHLVVALAGHEVTEIGDVYFNDEIVGPLNASGYPTAGRYYLQTTTGGGLTKTTTDSQGVNRTPPVSYQYHYVTLPHTPLTITITDAGLDTANNPTGTPYVDGGGTWTKVSYDSVPSGMAKNYPNDPGDGYIPHRKFGVSGNVVKMSACHSQGGNITITYTTTSSSVSYYARILKHLGAADQVADATLVSANLGWTSGHRLRGVAYVIASMSYKAEIYPRGIPNIKAVVKGKKLYDPRTGATTWSDNPALVARDYIASEYGLGCPSSEIDDVSFIAAADICDQLVTIDVGGATQKRYTCNGVVDTGQRPTDILGAVMSSCAGLLVWQGGKWTMHAGAYAAPTGATLTADDLRGAVKVSARVPRESLFNAVKGTFVDPARGYLPQDYPIQRNNTYVANDGGYEVVRDYTLPMTTNIVAAQRLAKQVLDRARQGIVVQWPGTPNLLSVCVGERKRITLPHMGWSDKEFLVTDWALSETGAVDLTLQEEASAAYDWNYGLATLVDPAPDTALPDPFYCPAPTTLVAVSGTDQLLKMADGTVVSRIYATWDAAPVGVVSTRVRYRRTTDSGWSEAAVDGASAWLAPVEDASTYIVQVSFSGALGNISEWTTADHTVTGKALPPHNVAGFSGYDTGPAIFLSWAAVSDADLRAYEIRIGASWATASVLTQTVATSYLAPGTSNGSTQYWVAALDTTGHYSDAPTAFTVVVYPPEKVGGLGAAYGADNNLVLSWAAVSDPRPITYEVRKGKYYGSAIVVARQSSTSFKTIGNDTYWVTAVAYLSRSAPALFIVSGGRITDNVIVATDERAALWPGTRNNLYLYGSGRYSDRLQGSLVLAGHTLVSTFPVFSAIFPSVVVQVPMGGVASYLTLADVADVGAVQNCAVSVDWAGRGENMIDIISAVMLVSSMATFTGESSSSIVLQMATAGDDGTYGAWIDFVPGVYPARLFKFRVVMGSTDEKVAAILDKLSITIDVPDITQRGSVSLLAAGGAVVFPAPYHHVAPTLNITISNASDGDTLLITNQTTAGFTAQVMNAGVGAARNIAWLAQGY